MAAEEQVDSSGSGLSNSERRQRAANRRDRQKTESGRAWTGRRITETDFLEMANAIRDVFWVFDWQKQEVTYASPAYETIWGRRVEDLYRSYEAWIAGIHPDDLAYSEASFLQVIEAGGGAIRPYRIVRPDGAVRWISDRAYPVRDEQGRVCRVIGVAEDITEHRCAEDSLRESELRLRAAIESLPFDFFMLDNEGRYTMVNSVCRANWAVQAGQHPEEMSLDEATLALWRRNNQRALAGEVVRGEVELTPRGRRGHFYNIISPIRSGDEIRGILGVNIDITAQKQAEAALQRAKDELEERVRVRTAELEAEVARRQTVEGELRESEEKYRTLVESAGDAISTVRADGELLFVNKTVAQYCHCSPEEIVGRKMWEVFPSAFVDDQMVHIHAVLRTGTGRSFVWPMEMNEESRWFSVTIEPLRFGGRNDIVLVIARDISDLIRARKQLEEYREQMTRADRMASLGTMSAMVAHELTQPLTVLRLSLQNAQEAIRSGEACTTVIEDLDNSVEEIAAMTDIIERFRGFARASSPGPRIDVNLSAVARHIVDLTAEVAERARVSITWRGLEQLPCFQARARDMEQVFFALLMNAIQAADGATDRSVVIQGCLQGRDIELLVEDNCGGIPAEYVDRILTPLFTTKAGGTGLGLSVVEHILDRYQGRLQVTNRPGEGVTFKVILPRSDGSS